MKKVVGIGGILFKCQNPEATRTWYKKHLDIGNTAHGHTFTFIQAGNPESVSNVEWCPFKADTEYFAPSVSDFMINYRVDNLELLLINLKNEGINPIGAIEDSEFGRFAWILDPEGRKIELWEPIK